MRYFKGQEVSTGRKMIYKLYDEPQKIGIVDRAAKDYIIVASALEEKGLTSYATIEDCQKDHYILREISEQEYECYILIQFLLTEMYYNQFIGGFPRFDADRVSHEMSGLLKDYQNAVRNESPKGKPIDIYNGEVS